MAAYQKSWAFMSKSQSTVPKEVEGNKSDDPVFYHIGRGLHLVESEYKGAKKIHLRRYEKNDQGKLYPTKDGITLSLDSTVELINLLEDLKKAVKEIGSTEQISFHHHIGGGNYLSINTSIGHPVHVRRWYKLEDMSEARPTKTGVTLKVSELLELEKALNNLKDSIPNIMDFEHPFHNGQIEHFTCSFCCPYEYKKHMEL